MGYNETHYIAFFMPINFSICKASAARIKRIKSSIVDPRLSIMLVVSKRAKWLR
jgi:hypothetical protein